MSVLSAIMGGYFLSKFEQLFAKSLDKHYIDYFVWIFASYLQCTIFQIEQSDEYVGLWQVGMK